MQPDGMVYSRGSKNDFDAYAEITGDPGWSWNNMQQYFRKVIQWYICDLICN